MSCSRKQINNRIVPFVDSWSDETIREQLRKAVAASSISYNAQTRQVTLLVSIQKTVNPQWGNLLCRQ